jgi:hypothetical protein
VTRPRRTLEQLRALSPNLAHVGGLGSDEGAAEWIQELVARSDVADGVPDDVRSAIDVAVELHIRGIFAWELFTAATVQARLTRELALGIRFLEFYARRIPLERRDRGGAVVATGVVEVGELRVVRLRLARRGSHARTAGWRLVGHPDFNGSLASLFAWAQREQLLRSWLDHEWTRRVDRIRQAVFYYGVDSRPPVPPRPADLAAWSAADRERWLQRDYRAGWERELIEREVEMRNDAAHPTMQAVFLPTWSAAEIESLVLFVNLLWSSTSSDRRDLELSVDESCDGTLEPSS